MNKETFIQEVQEEIDYLRNNITEEQRENLVASNFDRQYGSTCIYGLLKLNNNTYKPKYVNAINEAYFFFDDRDTPFEEHNFTESDTNSLWNRTALEKYLFMIPRNNQIEILEYIKGQRLTVDLHII